MICSALSCGATGYTFSAHPANLQILDALGASGKVTGRFDLYPVLPYAEGYVRLANEKGMSGLAIEILSRLSLSDRAKLLVEGGFSALKLDPRGMLKTYLDVELKGYLSVKPKNAVLRSVLLHEVPTDLCLGLQETSLLNLFAQHVRDSYHVRPGFVTYNLVRFVRIFRDAGISLKDIVIMTPFNGRGFQMSPSKESCQTCLSHLSEGDVIAMSIMAGGFQRLDEAITYIRSLPKLSGIAVGASTREHAHETFAKLRTLQ